MTTITLWLLVSIGTTRYGHPNTPTMVVERFATAQECERVRNWMAPGKHTGEPALGCIEAKVVRP